MIYVMCPEGGVHAITLVIVLCNNILDKISSHSTVAVYIL